MTQELIYTSAPRGLRPGSQGFCTVVSTQGMPVNLARQLETLSGYRHLFPPGSPQESKNPVLYAHLHIRIGDQPYHVLSRIATAGVDYSRRSNKLAHHVVLKPEELPPSGPAWLLSQPGFMETQWDGKVRLLPAGRAVPADPSPVGLPGASLWHQTTGDAGWAGLLAETAFSSQPAVLLVPVGMDPLPLLAEALALLPAQYRWKVTFTTYYIGLPPGITCQWRCMVEGTPEAVSARRTRGALVLDLCQPMGPAPDSPSVQAAREGRPIPLPESAWVPMPTPAAEKQLPVSPATPPSQLVEAFSQPTPMEHLTPPPLPSPPTTIIHGFRRKRRPWIWAGAAIGLVLLLVVAIGIPLLLRWQRLDQVVQDIFKAPSSGRQETSGTPPTKSDPAGKVQTASGLENKPPSRNEDSQTAPTQPEGLPAASPKGSHSSPTPSDTKTEPSGPSQEVSKPSAPPPPDVSRKTDTTPPSSQEPSPQGQPASQAHRPPKRYWLPIPDWKSPASEDPKPAEIEISLEELNFPDDQLELELLVPDKPKQELCMEIQQASENPRELIVGKPTHEVATRLQKIGEIKIKNKKLSFSWRTTEAHSDWRNWRHALGDCLLVVKKKGEKEPSAYVQLRQPPHLQPLGVSADKLRWELFETTIPLKDLTIEAKLAYKTQDNNKRPDNMLVKLDNQKITLSAGTPPVTLSIEIKPSESSSSKKFTASKVTASGNYKWDDSNTFDSYNKIYSHITNQLKALETRRKKLEEESKQKENSSQKEALQEQIGELQREIEKYKDAKTRLDTLKDARIHYSVFHIVRDSQGKEYRVYVGFTDEKMLLEEEKRNR